MTIKTIFNNFFNEKFFLYHLTDDDKQLCIQLLKNIEIKFSALWQKHKGKVFDDIYKELMADKKEKTAGVAQKKREVTNKTRRHKWSRL